MTHPTQPAQLDLEAIEARAKAATPGPWTFDQCDDGSVLIYTPGGGDIVCVPDPNHDVGEVMDHRNFAFIAASRTDIPALTAECRALQTERDTWARIIRESAETADALRVRAEKAEAKKRDLLMALGQIASWGTTDAEYRSLTDAIEVARAALIAAKE